MILLHQAAKTYGNRPSSFLPPDPELENPESPESKNSSLGNAMRRLDFDLACFIIGNDMEKRQQERAKHEAEREARSRPKTRKVGHV